MESKSLAFMRNWLLLFCVDLNQLVNSYTSRCRCIMLTDRLLMFSIVIGSSSCIMRSGRRIPGSVLVVSSHMNLIFFS